MNPAPFRDSRSASQLCSEPVDESTTYSWITFLRTFACKLCSTQGSRLGDCSYSLRVPLIVRSPVDSLTCCFVWKQAIDEDPIFNSIEDFTARLWG